MSTYLDSWGLLVPALKSVGEAWVNHFSDSRLYVSMAASMSVLWIPTDTRINMCWGRSATEHGISKQASVTKNNRGDPQQTKDHGVQPSHWPSKG